MHVAVSGTRLWFDVDGTAVEPDGTEMREWPTVVLVHGGPGCDDHLYFKPDRRDRPASVDCPTLVGVGELDPIFPIAAAEETAAALPGGLARLEVVEGAGHFPWKDAPDRDWPLVTDFVTATEPRLRGAGGERR
jgi:pimeloyl-ACP methyl ester carboxylesterase